MKHKVVMTSREFIPDINGAKKPQVIKVYFDRETDDFFVSCPYYLLPWNSGIISGIMDGVLHADRPQKALAMLMRLCEAYAKALTTKRKVVAYRLQCDEDMPFKEGEGLLIQWNVGWEVTTPSERRLYKYEPPDDPNTFCLTQRYLFDNNCSERDVKVLDWTSEREAFFIELSKAIQALKARCKLFLGDEKELAVRIALGANLLSLPPKEE